MSARQGDCVDPQHNGPAEHSWTLIPGFLIRSTGFPFEPFDALRLTHSQQSAREALARQKTIQVLQDEFTTDLFTALLDREQRREAPPEVFALWYKLNRCVRKAMPCPDALYTPLKERNAETGRWIVRWNRALAEATAAMNALATSVSAELRHSRVLLYNLVQDERFQEALLLSNLNMFTVALPSYLRAYNLERRSTKMRQLERQLYAYLQRFCTKNDTTSFFGPIDYGWFDLNSPEPLLYQRTADERLLQRLTRLSFWAAQALADCIARDPAVQPHLVPYLQHGCALLPGNELEIILRHRRIRLAQAAVLLLRRMNGRQTAADLCQSDEHAWCELRRLHEKGLVVWRLDIPTAVFDPLSWLFCWMESVPESCATRTHWLTHLEWFRQASGRFSEEPPAAKLTLLQEVEERFTSLTNLEARRGEGSIYVDRMVLYEEAQGSLEHCTVGAPFAHTLLAQLRPTLDLCASYSCLVQEVCQRYAQELFLELGGQPQPYLPFIHVLDERLTLAACLADPQVRQYQERLESLATQRQLNGCIHLRDEDLRPFQRQIPAGTVLSPDLFLAAPDVDALLAGKYQAVIGEIHYGFQVWCHFLTFSSRNAELAAALNEVLPEPPHGRLRAMLVHRRTQGKTFYLELPGLSVEVLGRSMKDRECVLPVADLEVARDETGLVLRSRSLNRALELYAADPRSISNWLFSTPPVLMPTISIGEHTPRIEIEGVVYQRERWTLPVADVLPPPTLRNDATALLLHASELCRRYGLPERAFARVLSERKPLYVDFANIFSLELFFHSIRHDSTVMLSEVLPVPERWWLRGHRGTSSCEWRMTAIYGGLHG
ncbi:MAG TPA: lantibiotic dehydratase [Ktedonobacteraceae bacterium]|nr:lantibiotic dehydratase [Ktedonobacteraceae bacterium]